jgi:glycosyltransferase involved in cell wall biosynthesis
MILNSIPLVSVAVITFNQLSFLKECLKSILDQDYPNIEIIVADDGSTDGTAEFLKEYAYSGINNFILRRSEINQGITKNCNLAYLACTGKYISLIAGDDLMLPGKLSTQVHYMEQNPDCSISYHDVEVFDSSTGITIRKYSDVDKPRTGGMDVLVKYGAFNAALSNMIRRDCSPLYGFDERLPIASDWLFFIECLSGGGKIRYIDKILGRYRRHTHNITSGSTKNPSLREIQDHLFSCDIILSRFPSLYREVKWRKAYHLKSLRFYNNALSYDDYLRASLSFQFNYKVLLALSASIFLGYHR